MTNDQLANLLRDKGAAIVHFSNHADMGRGTLFPHDLENAIQNRKCWSLSCHAIWPGHKMPLVGSVGIIFEPLVKDVLKVNNCDSGSSDHGSGGELLTIDSFYRSFQVADEEYNEWRIIGAKVKGIFVSNLDCILTRQAVCLKVDGHDHEQIISAEPTTLHKVIAAFPKLQMYTMGPAGLKLISR